MAPPKYELSLVVFRVRHFLTELKRRKVCRVAVAYAIVGFAVIEGAQLTFDALGFPRVAWQFVVVLTILGSRPQSKYDRGDSRRSRSSPEDAAQPG